MTASPRPSDDDLTAYAGRWVAVIKRQVVGQGETQAEALLSARVHRFKESPEVFFVPTQPIVHPDQLLETILSALPDEQPVYFVGGMVRDQLLGRRCHDWDFVVPKAAMRVAKRVADALGAAYYPMDGTHDTARVIWSDPQGERIFLDFTSFRGVTIEDDLRARDLTVNAMAIDCRRLDQLIDPLGGLADLREKRLRACSAEAFVDDPLRILRAVRQSAALGFRITRESKEWMRHALPGLAKVSAERVRDELFRILDGPKPDACIRALDALGALAVVLPELGELHGVEQSAPHVYNVWEHTVGMAQKLNAALAVLSGVYDEEKAANLPMGLMSATLGRFRQQITGHLAVSLNPDRGLRPLLFLAALYHDVSKPATKMVDENGRTRFFDHDIYGAQIAAERGRALRLSNVEVERLQAMVRFHMRPFFLAKGGTQPSARSVYRFFRDAGPAGVDVCLLSLADFLATYGAQTPQDAWRDHLQVVRYLMSAWWEKPEQSVRPPALLNGDDLRQHFELAPGRLIGDLLDRIREAQVAGEVGTREEALDFARRILDR